MQCELHEGPSQTKADQLDCDSEMCFMYVLCFGHLSDSSLILKPTCVLKARSNLV